MVLCVEVRSVTLFSEEDIATNPPLCIDFMLISRSGLIFIHLTMC